ncbi:MAG TPA: hypothetical protein DCX92_12310, partial [Bacteroidetes bacterium]|nr:hypothetical protein [Bacteroidota bacterium]
MNRFLVRLIAAGIFLCNFILVYAQNEDVRWSMDPSTKLRVSGDYVDLPQSIFFQNPNVSERHITTTQGSY